VGPVSPIQTHEHGLGGHGHGLGGNGHGLGGQHEIPFVSMLLRISL